MQRRCRLLEWSPVGENDDGTELEMFKFKPEVPACRLRSQQLFEFGLKCATPFPLFFSPSERELGCHATWNEKSVA